MLISVVIAVRNGADYINETLDSLLDQTIDDWDCWVVDDGSVDRTCEIVETYIAKDKRFNLIRTAGGGGPYVAANIGIDSCCGEFVARVDADDVCLPERLQIQRDALVFHTNLNICCSEHYNLLPSGSMVHKKLNFDIASLSYYLMFNNPLLHSTMFFRRQWFLSLGKYPKKRLAQDYFIWCSAILNDDLLIIKRPLLIWRLTETSITKLENTQQTEHALSVNNWYLNQLTQRQISTEISKLYFGTYRGIKNLGNILLLEGISLLKEIELSGFFQADSINKIRPSLLYDLISRHRAGRIMFLRIIIACYQLKPTLLFHPKFFKLYGKILLNK